MKVPKKRKTTITTSQPMGWALYQQTHWRIWK